MSRGFGRRVLALFIVFAAAALGWREIAFRAAVEQQAQFLEAVASEIAATVNADQHERVRAPADATGPEFLALRDLLRAGAERHHLDSPVYTLRPTPDGDTEFVVMSNAEPFVGARYPLRDAMRPVLSRGERARTGIYGDDHGRWVSAYAPVQRDDGSIVALLEVDRDAKSLRARHLRSQLLAVLGALTLALVVSLAPGLLAARRGPLAALRRLIQGRLAVRIGLAGSLAVVVAVGIAGWLDHRAARDELVGHSSEQLLTAVRVGALLVDVDAHEAVARDGDATSDAFLGLRDRLRHIRDGAGLTSPLYTLRRDGKATRFVVMTNETPFVGDIQELRPGVAATFRGEGAGSEGPYTNSTDTWISAWAPINAPDGRVVAVLQADLPVGTLLTELDNRSLRRLLFALAGVALAFAAAGILARNIARPIALIAQAAERIGQGDLNVHLPEDRIDEVGALSRAVNGMAHGLRERERLRDMFGKYMASQVVTELLERGELTLEGETREITAVLSDIRGYTALSEALGAVEVVALLNEYFGMLVEVVVAEDGVVDKFMGDAMLCWFGAPVPSSDHRTRAVRAALRMTERLAEWNERRVAAGLQPVATGIGVASGQVVVGNIGSAQRYEYTAIGDAVNLASRLCSKAGAGEILVTDAIRREAEAAGVGVGRFESLGPIEVKGVAEPVPLHRITVPIVRRPA